MYNIFYNWNYCRKITKESIMAINKEQFEIKLYIFKNRKQLANLHNFILNNEIIDENVMKIQNSFLVLANPIYRHSGELYIKELTTQGRRYFNYCVNNKTKFSFNIIMTDTRTNKKTISKIKGSNLKKLFNRYTMDIDNLVNRRR